MYCKLCKYCNSLPPLLDGGGGFAYNEREPGAAPTQSKGLHFLQAIEPRTNQERTTTQRGRGLAKSLPEQVTETDRSHRTQHRKIRGGIYQDRPHLLTI